MSANHARRLNVLAKWAQPKCQRCYSYPVRVVTVDGATDAVLTENFPPSGCPDCQKPLMHEIRIVADTDGSS